MDDSYYPRMFLILGIGNFVLCIMSFILAAIFPSLKDTGLLIFSLCFLNLASLAMWQYKALRALNAKFQDLYSRLPPQQQAAK